MRARYLTRFTTKSKWRILDETKQDAQERPFCVGLCLGQWKAGA